MTRDDEFLICADCDRALDDCDWDGSDTLCEKCRKETDVIEWIEETETWAKAEAEKNGWDFEHMSGYFYTKSRYYELSRKGVDDEGDEAWETIKLRVSDHGSMYCSEDISLAKNPYGTDHTRESLTDQLSKPFDGN